jgi:hypothetical protein
VIVPVVVVTLSGTNPDVQRDLDAANEIYGREAGVFFEIAARLEVDAPDLNTLSQEDCNGVGHVVSDEEDRLFSLGRNLGADLVAYYIGASSFGASILGCAAHPVGRRGFWVVANSSFDFVFAHEATHVIGDNNHELDDTTNLMFPAANRITDLPPDLNLAQVRRILDDPALLSVESIVLNL